MNYKGIVFDKDGTLLDFNQTWLPVYQHAAMEISGQNKTQARELLGRHGYDFDSEQFLGGSLLAAGNNDEIARAWAQDLDQKNEIEFFSRQLGEIFQQHGPDVRPPLIT